MAYDDQYDAATGKAIVERMVEQDQVFALVGLGGNIVETSLDYLKEKGIPVINISSGLDSVYAENDPSSNIFQIQPANMTDARNLIARVLHESIFGPNKDEKLPADAKIAVVHGTDSASMSSLEHLKEIAEEEGATDRLVIQAVTQDTYATAIQQFKNENCQVVIFMGVDSTTWISAMDDAQYEVPVVFSYGASTIQSFVPDTYKATRPCYATIWGDYSGEAGQAMLDDMVDALSYLDDIDEATRASYRDNNYCVAGYAYGMAVVQAFQRYNDHEGEYGLNWNDFIKVMELEPFQFGAVEYDYMNGKRMGIDTMAFVEYVGDPATGEEEMIPCCPLRLWKRSWQVTLCKRASADPWSARGPCPFLGNRCILNPMEHRTISSDDKGGSAMTTFVNTPFGALEGTEQDGVYRFLGVPFAEKPLGELRFRAPPNGTTLD